MADSEFNFDAEMLGVIPHLRAFARSISGNRDLADDLVQETLCRGIKARDRFEPGTSMRAWLFIILRNYWLSEKRRDRFRNGPSLDDEINLGFIPGIPSSQQDTVELHQVFTAMAQLSPDMLEALERVGVDGFKYEEASRMIDVALGTIKSRVGRARIHLTVLLADGKVSAKKLNARQRKAAERLIETYG